MKKLLSLFMVACMMCCLVSCKGKPENISTSHDALEVFTDDEAVSEEILSEETTDKQVVFVGKTSIILDSGTHRFQIPKTDFENRFSEELLLEFANMISMDFGVEDYDWNKNGQDIFTDVRNCTAAINNFMLLKNVLNADFDREAYKLFLNDIGLEYGRGAAAVTFSLEDYNQYLKLMFGPDVRQLKISDFETGKTAKEKGLPVDGDISESDFRCFYSGKDNIIVCQLCATEYGCLGEYIYDVKKDGNDYYVYTVGTFETYGQTDDFALFQSQGLESLEHNIGNGYIQTKTYKFGMTDDGNVYMKSVDKKYMISENAGYEYVVVSDEPATVLNKKSYTEDYHVVAALPKGTKVIMAGWSVIGNRLTDEKGLYGIVTEDCWGLINGDCLEEIKE